MYWKATLIFFERSSHLPVVICDLAVAKLFSNLERDQTRLESLVPYNCEAFSSQEERKEEAR